MQDLREKQAAQDRKVQEVIQVRKVPVEQLGQLDQKVIQAPGDQPDQPGRKDRLAV